MRKRMVWLTIALLIVAATAANAEIVVNLYSASAPNVYSSAPYPTWWSNAQTAIRSNATTYGSGAAQYVELSATGTTSAVLDGYNAIATGFQSWQGVAGAPGEWGHRMHFIYSIYDTTGADVSLANIHGIDVLENGWGDAAYPLFGGASFDAATVFDVAKRVGYDGNGNLVTTGNTAKQIIGNFGMAYAAYFSATGAPGYWQLPGDTQQDTLNHAIADIDANLYSWTGLISYGDVSATTVARFKGADNSVPEPMSIVLGIMGLGSIAGYRRFRK